jgi:hypothetical protein
MDDARQCSSFCPLPPNDILHDTLVRSRQFFFFWGGCTLSKLRRDSVPPHFPAIFSLFWLFVFFFRAAESKRERLCLFI